MKRISTLALACVVTLAACGRATDKLADTTLNTDLSLAAQQRGVRLLDSVSAVERAAGAAAIGSAAASRTPTHRVTSGGDVSRSRRSTSSGGSRTSTAASQPSSGTVEKHTQRDAAIGAAAGAVIGATTSRNKVKGGLIGAAVGGILGGVIGNNVDKRRKP